ncbi:hypothetical protein OUZ56_030310 [Daphnia magna]|uniref:Uncharacterized protein n=1 Tax=Daphnia magna TaxID=35525 RepID=A0ABQ9ZQX1_9CRUS|nr:hypothetical protein OUZ56_030310 [Daphnia magna]
MLAKPWPSCVRKKGTSPVVPICSWAGTNSLKDHGMLTSYVWVEIYSTELKLANILRAETVKTHAEKFCKEILMFTK